jgi:transcriptional regulator with XRE-family HTH domain
MNSQLDEISARLRSIRRSRNLTLAAIEKNSHGSINAISLGSYERGDRALTVRKAIEIARFYEVPLSYLITGRSPITTTVGKTMIDLRRVKTLVLGSGKESSSIERIALSFISGIIKARQDFNGEILSLREKDCDYLTIAIGCTQEELLEYLEQNNLLVRIK